MTIRQEEIPKDLTLQTRRIYGFFLHIPLSLISSHNNLLFPLPFFLARTSNYCSIDKGGKHIVILHQQSPSVLCFIFPHITSMEHYIHAAQMWQKLRGFQFRWWSKGLPKKARNPPMDMEGSMK